MANVRYQLGVEGSLIDSFDNGLNKTQVTPTEVTWSSLSDYSTFSVEGHGFEFENGQLIAGTVEKVIFRDVEGLVTATITGKYKNIEAFGEKLGTISFDDLLFARSDKIIGSTSDDRLCGLNGADRILGREGSDHIEGGRGNDRLTGGAASDVFVFRPKSDEYRGDGNDTITDFDANGKDGQQDYLGGVELTFIRKSGHDTIIEYEGGSVTLLDIRPSQITEQDFEASVIWA